MRIEGTVMLRERYESPKGGRVYWTILDVDNGGDIKLVEDDGNILPVGAKLMHPYHLTAEVRGRLYGNNCVYQLVAAKLAESDGKGVKA